NNDIHVLSALHAGDPLATPNVCRIAKNHVGGWLGALATSTGNATIDGADFGRCSAETRAVVQGDVDLGTIRGALTTRTARRRSRTRRSPHGRPRRSRCP
ncbi:hypothetical protein, partial [Paracoccus spongiarum]